MTQNDQLVEIALEALAKHKASLAKTNKNLKAATDHIDTIATKLKKSELNSKKDIQLLDNNIPQLVKDEVSKIPKPTNGLDGKDGSDGKDGLSGKDGRNGTDGKDGVQGIPGLPGQNGKDGNNGQDGEDGIDGIGIDTIEGKDGKLVIYLTDGTKHEVDLPKGKDGLPAMPVPARDTTIHKLGNMYDVNIKQASEGQVLTFKNGKWGASTVESIDGGSSGVAGQDGASAYDIWLTEGNTGTEQNFLDSLIGPQGLTGDAGEQGIPGADGLQGLQGIQGVQGVQGLTGADGDSAYDIAATNGFVGTEVEWIASLHGNDGINGTNGTNGSDGYTPIKGVDYFDGIDGATGATGADGYTPIKGVDYFDGADGSQGIQGVAGNDGNDGYTPIKGIDYFDGVDGNDGATGPQGIQGATGPAGADGSDANVTKANVEAVLTGEISSHTHASSGGDTKDYGSFYLSGAGNTGLTSTEVTLTINSTRVNSGVMTLATNQVTVNKTGVFEIYANVYLNNSSTARTEYSMWIEKNGVEIAGSRFASYQRGYDSGMSSSVMVILDVTSGDTFKIQCQRTDGNATAGYQDANGTNLNIKEL